MKFEYCNKSVLSVTDEENAPPPPEVAQQFVKTLFVQLKINEFPSTFTADIEFTISVNEQSLKRKNNNK
jgi:hypothetical protein